MPRMAHSPTAATSAKDQKRVMSSPDISNIDKEPEPSNTSSRSKRFRPDFSPEQTSDFKAFERKVMSMLTAWKEDQDIALNKLTKDINEVKLQNTKIQKIHVDIEKSIEFVNLAFEDMKRMVERLEKERQEQRTCILELERRILDLQQSTRSSSLEIRNIPYKDNETTADLTSLMMNTCNALSVPLKASELRDIYRIPGKKGSNRPIVAELQSVPLKGTILNASRAFNKGRRLAEKLHTGHIGLAGEPQSVYVAEHLPTSQRQLFYETRKFAKLQDYKFCWTQNNKIFLRKLEGMEAIIVTSVACLDKLSKLP